MTTEIQTAALLESLVGDLADFKKSYWRARPVHRIGVSSSQFRELVSLVDVDRLLADPRTRPPYVRVTLNSRKLDSTLFTRRATVARQPVTDVPDAAAIMRLFQKGATITVDSLQESIPTVGLLCTEIASALVGDVHAIAFITPRGKQGFASHTDAKEALILQFAGTKTWRVYDRPSPVSMENSLVPAARTGAPIMEVDLKAGDILYVPWGYPHDAVSGPEISAHLSLMIRPPTWAEVVNGSLHAALKEAVLGESPTWSRSDEALFKEEFLSRLDKALRAASDPGFRDKIAQFAWNAYLQTGMKDEYTSLAELARPAESGQR